MEDFESLEESGGIEINTIMHLAGIVRDEMKVLNRADTSDKNKRESLDHIAAVAADVVIHGSDQDKQEGGRYIATLGKALAKRDDLRGLLEGSDPRMDFDLAQLVTKKIQEEADRWEM